MWKLDMLTLTHWVWFSTFEATFEVQVKADSHIACRAHAVPQPCRETKGLECVFPIWFIHCDRVWFTLAMPRPCPALTMLFFSNQMGKTHSKPLVSRHGRGTAWARHVMCESAFNLPDPSRPRRSVSGLLYQFLVQRNIKATNTVLFISKCKI
jgi:hypothetical protein